MKSREVPAVRPTHDRLRTNAARRYNIHVPDTTRQDDHKHHRHAVYASETTGLLLIALVLLVLTLVRYWHDIHWSLR
jgi:hypothetical protein